MPFVQLKRTWPGNFQRTLPDGPVVFTPGVPVEIEDADMEFLGDALGVCLYVLESPHERLTPNDEEQRLEESKPADQVPASKPEGKPADQVPASKPEGKPADQVPASKPDGKSTKASDRAKK